MIYKSILFAMLVSSSMTFGIMGIAKEFVPLFYGKQYTICVNLYLVLLPSCLFLAFANVIRTQYLLPKQLDKPYVISAFLGAIVNIVVNLLLIPVIGAVGAGVGTLFAEMSVCIYQCWTVRKSLPIRKYIITSLPLVIIGMVMFLILYNISFENLVIGMGVKIIMGIFIFGVGCCLYACFFLKNFDKVMYDNLKESIISMRRRQFK